ncbi:histidine decarboxylase [Streptomyces albus subsp. chlorinus]|nr:histidine decarboxylase [Streptomyces albus subsp. chlorinus]
MLSQRDLTIGERPSPAAETGLVLRTLSGELLGAAERLVGFPGNLAFDDADCGHLLSHFINNVGDPDSDDAAGTHTKRFERAVLAWFTGLAQGDPDGTYGYVTGGGTEGVIFGLYVGRRRLPHAPVYTSEAAHYSVRKAADLLRMGLVTVPTRQDGTMDPEALGVLCRARRDGDAAGETAARGAVVLATAGTTMGGVFDDVTALRAAASAAGEVHVHCDAALGGIVAAFSTPRPAWDFRDGADTISVSGHKFLGSPVPSGIVLARREMLPELPVGEYVGADDHTLACSRNGLAPVLLWKRLRELGTAGLRDLVHRCQATAAYAYEALAAAGARPQRWRHALAVTFDRPPRRVCARWRLTVEGDRAQLIAMPHVTRRHVDELVDELCAAWQSDDEERALPAAGHGCGEGRTQDARRHRSVRPW